MNTLLAAHPPLEAEDIYLARQPIVDRGRQLHGFELLFRNSRSNHAQVDSNATATSAVILRTLSQFGMESVLGSLPGFINCDAEFLCGDTISLLPADKVVLELLESTAASIEVQRRCLELKSHGFKLALDDFQGATDANRGLLPMVDIIKVDIAQLAPARLDAVARELRALNATRVAEKVETHAQFEFCSGLGFHLFQGYHFARPQMVAGRQLSQSQAALMHMLGLLRQDADMREIEDGFKRHPALAIDLLRLANSAAFGMQQPLRSIANAVLLLGRRQLERWMLLMLLAGSGSAESQGPRPALLHLGATRGKLMELLMLREPEHAAFADSAFIVGIVSVMDAVLGQDMAQVAAALGLASELRAALLRREGALGSALALAQALEREDGAAVSRFVDARPERGLEMLNRTQGQALEWANRILMAA
jgi:EAL and modified HD-GYP domain-containing signal transduction protein